MSIKISAPEFLIASSCALLCTGRVFEGIAFLVLGISGTIFRAAIENSVRIENNKKDLEAYASIQKAGESIAGAISRMTVQREDSEYN
jgi:hypothetical protein